MQEQEKERLKSFLYGLIAVGVGLSPLLVITATNYRTQARAYALDADGRIDADGLRGAVGQAIHLLESTLQARSARDESFELDDLERRLGVDALAPPSLDQLLADDGCGLLGCDGAPPAPDPGAPVGGAEPVAP